MNRIKRILVGIDFSPASLDALMRARQLAARAGAEVEAISVVDSYVVRELHELTGEPLARLASLAAADQGRRLREFIEEAGVRAGEVGAYVVEGNPFMGMLERARRRGVDLVVLGRQGRGAHVGRDGVGSLAARSVRKLPTKVMLVARGHAEAPRRVMACVDMSSTSRSALVQAIRVAMAERRPLDIINVYPPPWFTPRSKDLVGLQRAEHQRLARERLKIFLHGLASPLAELEVTEHVVEAEEVSSAVTPRLGPQDLVVVGTRGRTDVGKELLLGSTAERIMRDTSASVLAIKPDGFDYGGS